MKNASILPALGLLTAASMAFGLHLGESAVSEIDPVHYRGPAIHPKDRGAAIDPQELRETQRPQFASLYGWEEGNAARAENCGDCDALAARDAYADGGAAYDYSPAVEKAVAYLEEAEEGWTEGDMTDEDQWRDARAEDDEDSYAVRTVRVERYAYYPVRAEEAEVEELEIVYPETAGGL